MIEILQLNRKYKVNCCNCDAVLRYEKSDIKTKTIHISQRIERECRYITCPNCLTDIDSDTGVIIP